jgi:hypothetical protein
MINKKRKRERRSQMRRLFELMATTERWLGQNNERRVVEAFTTAYPWPEQRIPWIYEVRLGTDDEDHRGIDVVFRTDVGDIGLQVKSSEDGRKHFIERQARGEVGVEIVVVYILPSYGPMEICKIVVPQIKSERNRRLRHHTHNITADDLNLDSAFAQTDT